MIQINSMAFDNVLSYGPGNVMRFHGAVTQLVGENGAGKSSIPVILEEALYNKNSRGIKKADLCNRYLDSKNYEISVQFDINGDHCFLRKVVSSTTKLYLSVNDEDVSGHTTTQTYKLLESMLGMDFNTFTKLVYQSMISSLDFMTATDANRKKFLISLLGLEKYVEAEKTVKDAAKTAKEQLATIQGSVNVVQGWLDKNGFIPEPKSLVPVPLVDPNVETILIDRVSELQNISLHNSMVETNLANHMVYNKLTNTKVKVVNLPPEGLDQIKKDLTQAKQDQAVLVSEQTKLKAVEANCPTCGAAMEVGDTIKLLEELEPQIASIKATVADLILVGNGKIREQRAYNTYQAHKLKVETASNAIDEKAPKELFDSASLSITIQRLRKDIDTQKLKVQTAQADNAGINLHNSSIELRKGDLDKYNMELREYSAQLDEVVMLVAKLDVIAAAFGTKGLIAYKIESMVKVFEGLINEYLQVLADGRFALSFTVEDTKLALKLYDSGVEIDIKSLSSGEFNRVNTATLLAVRKMMTSISKVDINVLFLDEVVSVLDANGKDTLIEVLLREKNLNSIVVSHGYTHPLADKIEVVKTDKISELIND